MVKNHIANDPILTATGSAEVVRHVEINLDRGSRITISV